MVAPDGDPFPGWVGATWDCAATPPLRREPAPGRGAVRRPAGAGPRRRGAAARARRCPTTTTSTPTPPGGPRTTTATCRASRSSSTPTRAGSRSATDVAAGPPQGARHATRVSAFGGVIAVNREVSVAMAEQVAEMFTEVVVAPVVRRGRAGGARAQEEPAAAAAARPRPPRRGAELRPISGGLLLQQRDAVDAPGDDPATLDARQPATPVDDDVARRPRVRLAGLPVGEVQRDPAGRRRGRRRGRHGPGQPGGRRRLAVARAGDRARGSVAASDAYFPFPDGLEVLLDAGVRAVVQPGGSVRDHDVDRGRRGRRRHDVPHRHAALLPLSGAAERTSDDGTPRWRAEFTRLEGRASSR